MRALCRLADLAATGAKDVVVQDAGVRKQVFVVMHGGHVRAYFNACPHARLPLNNLPDTFFDAGRDVLVCVNHGAHFDALTGKCVRGPCKGQTLRPLAVDCDGDSIVIADPDYVAGA